MIDLVSSRLTRSVVYAKANGEPMKSVRIGLIGDHDPAVVAHRAIPRALELAAREVDRDLDVAWVGTSALGPDVPSQLGGFAALWCVPGSPYANTEGALAAIRFAREGGRPFLGTCGGFQHALLEYVRNVLGHRRAEHAETSPGADMPLIAPLSCSLVEKSGEIHFAEGSRLRAIYGTATAQEHYHCNYGLNPAYEDLLKGTALFASGWDQAGEVRAVELEGHPFFIATLFQPERAALRGIAPPLVNAFVKAAAAWSETASHEHSVGKVSGKQ
jgi:CTP synthase (UTP-ammonia lyase)